MGKAAEIAAEDLTETAYNRGSGDNLSALVILLDKNPVIQPAEKA